VKLIVQYFRAAVRQFTGLFLISFSLSIMLTVMDILLPWGLRKYLDCLAKENHYGILVAGIVFFAGYLLIKIFVNVRWYISLDRFGGRYMTSLSLSLEESMAGTYYSEIEKMRPEIIRNILFTDVLNVFRVIGHQIPSMIGAIAVMAACLIVSFAYNIRMTLFIFLAVAVGFFVSLCSRSILSKSAGKTNAKLKIHDAWCTQFVEMLPFIQSHNILDYYQEHTKNNLAEFMDTAVLEDRKTLFWSGVTGGYHSFFSICLSALLAIPVAGNSVTDFVFFTMIANLVMQQAETAETMFQQMIKLHISFIHVDELLNLPQRNGTCKMEKIEEIDFDAVDFSYPGKDHVLREISCHLKKGDIVRLTGTNGSGKSTFIKLLTGLYPPTEGEIKLNGKSIKQYTKGSLNKQILYINQDERCLNETFQKYLEVVTSKKLEEHEFKELLNRVNLEHGRFIERNGDSLSAGQRKKLFILKFMLRREEASVIILDELTAGLDLQTTKQIYDFINYVAREKNKIILLVDHNLGSEINFTKEFVFEEGKILEQE
jgi:ABC-type bacteriocin/lantibiotic exporter with double-glycine peptidase domain